MARNQARTSLKRGVSAAAWQRGWRSLVYAGASASFGAAAWHYASNFFLGRTATPSRPVDLLVLACLHGLLTITLERGQVGLPLRRTWRCRLAFLAGPALALVNGLTHFSWVEFPRDILPLIGVFLAAGCGSFLGGLAATSWAEGLWENNSPPPARIEAEVHQLHRMIIGQPDPTPVTKRLFDLILALLGLALAAPVLVLSVFLIWLEDPGPVLFVKNSVGKGGVNFRQFKLRTMVNGAEQGTGPVLSRKGDERVLQAGRFLRKTALDELPQLVNILFGEMSFVGPRPQRTVLVHGYLQTLPEYAERHRMLPGLAGLAQVAGDYYLTPRQKLRFDRLYNARWSLGFDLKLLLLAWLTAFWFRWQRDWDGRAPRRLLRWGKKPQS